MTKSGREAKPGSGGRRQLAWPPRRRTWVLMACAAGAAALLLAGIVLFLKTKQVPPASNVSVDASPKGLHDWPADAPPPAIAPFHAQQALAHQEAWAKYLRTNVQISNSLGMKLRLIPPGEFLMGSPQAEIDDLLRSTPDGVCLGPAAPDQTVHENIRREGPQRCVRLTKGFFLGAFEVTQEQYQEIMGDNPAHFKLDGSGKKVLNGEDTSHHPVERIPWNAAIDFCNRLSITERLPPYYARFYETVRVLGGVGYRLPTEAEWEYACRAGTTARWSFSDDETDLDQHAWFIANSSDRTHQVGGLKANPYGLYDMYGNIREWCSDWQGEDAASPIAAGRVLRGGAFHDTALFIRSSGRYFERTELPSRQYSQIALEEDYRLRFVGFRVARTIDGRGFGISQPDDPPPIASVTEKAKSIQEAWAKQQGEKIEISNPLGMKLCLIPPGEFLMGASQAEIEDPVYDTVNGAAIAGERSQGHRGEGPQHLVRLTKAFYLGSCEVTQQQYQEVMGANPSFFSPGGQGKDAVQGLDTSQYPVENVSWFDAVDFCHMLSEREQLSSYYVRQGETVTVQGGTGYRLPTEAEWEYACRAGTTARWWFGDNEMKLAQHAWFANSGVRPVGKLAANPYGLVDMYGNVREWCWDWFGIYGAEAVSDPTGPAAGSRRALRGGAYHDTALWLRSAMRYPWGFPTEPNNSFGFRVARTYP